ncbi:type II toxin-antitoxin system RatA family toxin [Parvularcula lutaonensis]|uniref:Type II toxin-antitoxin system RatA family toxin n=1 Tax=Parvularcula lutaonensis TaxID=491923 RepID=A0ABV7ME42_9PROT|nr:type II toxin-antitoxin system RatA family toxin [Parvularcula lutaonensis]GGY49088.1 ubiquinone-binding protein [Parvularcula lutaonensis]
MNQHHERVVVPFRPEQMFDLVMRVEDYPKFIPWVEALRVREDHTTDGSGVLVADMAVKYAVFRETFRSRVTADRAAKTIDVRYIKGPLQDLTNNWKFEEHPKGCVVDFKLTFAFRNRLMQAAASRFVDHGFKKLSGAFIDEAHERYEPVS